MKLEYIVNKLTKYKTIKQVLKEEFLLSDRLIIKLKKSKQIYLNGYPVFINETVKLDRSFVALPVISRTIRGKISSHPVVIQAQMRSRTIVRQ